MPGSEAALRNAQEAIFLCIADTMKALQPALAPMLNADTAQDGEALRRSWINKLRFLNGCLELPDLSDLSVALEELGRGVTADALLPNGNRQGGKRGTDVLRLKAFAVEAANELRRRSAKKILYEDALEDLGTAASTIAKYRNQLARVPEFAPRVGWSLYWDEEPEIVLPQLIAAIKALNKI